MRGIEPLTFSLPRKRSTPELHRLLPVKGITGIPQQTSLSGRRGSNPRPTAWKAVALPTELLPHKINCTYTWWGKKDSNLRRHKSADLQSAPFGRSGISPDSPANTSRRFTLCKCTRSHLSESNQRPTDYKSVALPAELK